MDTAHLPSRPYSLLIKFRHDEIVDLLELKQTYPPPRGMRATRSEHPQVTWDIPRHIRRQLHFEVALRRSTFSDQSELDSHRDSGSPCPPTHDWKGHDIGRG
ncbi:hypothetical protein ACRALDRAFT_2033308 [Sodiomyces alcalophilus JCM 7366]|uniref:uncharacterized protein n=1 Tax=Sodiomyces alcalophilus JCM 7366 TaxID=591952 RepID=UPI0039B65709